jgi:hypothetical protein
MWIFGAKKWTADAQNHRIAAHKNENLGHANEGAHMQHVPLEEPINNTCTACGNDPTKVLYNCRKKCTTAFNFTTEKNLFTTAISFHKCKILHRNNRIKCTTAISFHNCKKIAQL